MKYWHFTNEEEPDNEEVLKDVSKILDTLVKDEVRRLITEDKVRPDGRKPEEIRPLASEGVPEHMVQAHLHVAKLKHSL